MRITMLSTMCGPEGNAYPGTVLEVEAEKAKELIDGMYARPYDKEKDAKPRQVGLDVAKKSA